MALYNYSLKYSANGGSGAPSTQSASSLSSSYTFTISSSEPSRTGYRFKGWANCSGGGVAWLGGEKITLSGVIGSTSSHTLYAYWQVRTYTVSYSANGGSGAPGSQTKTYNVALTLSSTTPTRSGYTFQGWATSASGGASYSPGGSYTDNASVTLYAVWSENAPTTYSVYYNANGGTGAPSSQTKTHGVTLTLRTGVPTRSGYTFLGWGTSSGATTPSYQPGGAYTSNSSITLYAVWLEDETPPPETSGVMYLADNGLVSGAPYIAGGGITSGVSYIAVDGVLKEGK